MLFYFLSVVVEKIIRFLILGGITFAHVEMDSCDVVVCCTDYLESTYTEETGNCIRFCWTAVGEASSMSVLFLDDWQRVGPVALPDLITASL